METNFFSNLIALGLKGDWTIHIKADESDVMTVSVLFRKACGDSAAKIIPPLIYPAKDATTLDSLFFKDIALAVPQADRVLSTMEQYLKEVERASKSAASQQKKSTAKAELPKHRKYDEALKLVDELEAQEKYSEAWMKVPEPSLYPEHSEFLRKRREELSRKFAPDLFAASAESPILEDKTEPLVEEHTSDGEITATSDDEESMEENEL